MRGAPVGNVAKKHEQESSRDEEGRLEEEDHD